MKKFILYILYTNNKYETFEVNNNKINIKIIKINPNIFSGQWQPYPCDIVYCDNEFLRTSYGRKLVNECFQPLASRNSDSQFILF